MWASLTSAEKTIAGAAVVTFVAAFLPWASVLGISVNGVDADGKITLVIALIGLAVLAFGRGRPAGRPDRSDRARSPDRDRRSR